jgi:hypothetical protein
MGQLAEFFHPNPYFPSFIPVKEDEKAKGKEVKVSPI